MNELRMPVRWLPRAGDKLALLNRKGEPIGIWEVADAEPSEPRGAFTITVIPAGDPDDV